MGESTERSESQAQAQLESILDMVAALECDYDRLEELREEVTDLKQELAKEKATLYQLANSEDSDRDDVTDQQETVDELEEQLEELEQELFELEKQAGDCEDCDDARNRIQEDPLTVEVRSGWCAPGGELEAEEFMILLCTGGPAVRIVGTLDQYKQPDSARLEHQDWFTPWIEYRLSGDEEEAVLKYCSEFYYGE